MSAFAVSKPSDAAPRPVAVPSAGGRLVSARRQLTGWRGMSRRRQDRLMMPMNLPSALARGDVRPIAADGSPRRRCDPMAQPARARQPRARDR